MPSKPTELLVNDPISLSRLIGRLRATYREKGYFRVKVWTSKKRSLSQNAMYHAWINQIYIERDEDSILAVRNQCKLSFFLPILCAENEEFAEVYANTLAKLPQALQIQAMELVDVTSVCTTSQMARGLEAMQMHYAALEVDPVMLEFPEDK